MRERIIYRGQELLPITSDIVFKSVFGSEENKDLLASLLNSFTDIDIKRPEQIEFVGTELIKQYGDDKLSRLDIRIKTEDNKHIDVEIQVVDKADMISRSLFYLSRLYTEQMREGMQYKALGRAVALNILCFNLFEEEDVISSYRFYNRVTHKELTDIMEINFVELKKVDKAHKDSMKDLWTLFLSADSEEELEMLSKEDERLQKAVEKLKYVSADDILRFEYDQRLKARLDAAADKAAAQEEGMKQGIEEGMKLGIEQGIEQGIVAEKVALVKKLTEMGMEIDFIVKVTGLTESEVIEITGDRYR